MKKITLLMLGIMALVLTTNAKNVYVDPVNGNDTGKDGLTWATAVKTLSGGAGKAVASDNILVKGGVGYTITSAVQWSPTTLLNYYGSCYGNEATPAERPLSDLDGNGIVEPWEFTYPTVLSFTGVSHGVNFSGTGYVNGFSITQTAAFISALRTVNMNATSSFINNTIKNCTLSSTTGATVPYGILISTGGTVSNCLIEKNIVTVVATADISYAPIMSVGSGTKVSRCVIRNNKVIMDYSTSVLGNGATRGLIMLITPTPSGTPPFTAVRNCVINNNSVFFKGNSGVAGATPANLTMSNGSIVAMQNTASATDSIYNCTITNNKGTKIKSAGLNIISVATTSHYVMNNVSWNNQTDGSVTTTSNITGSITLGLIANNYANGGFIWNTGLPLVIYGNSSSLDAVTNLPNFKTASTYAGFALSDVDSLASINHSNWKISSGSYLIGKGVATSLLIDKDGKYFASTPAVGAYEYVPTPVITFAQDLTGLTTSNSPVTLTASSTAGANPATITYTSSNTGAATIIGSTLTLVGPGTTTIIAHQAGNAYYEAAADVAQTVDVTGVVTNLSINGGFEDAVGTFTVVESAKNMLLRVNAITDATTQTSSPTSSATTVTNGMWLTKQPNSGYVRGEVVTTTPHSGSSCLNFRITNNSTTTNFNLWSTAILQQRLSLTNTQKYTVSFWAKVDATAQNVASNVVVFLTDNAKKTNLSCDILLTGGTTWTQYSATFDVPAFVAANSTADFTTAYVGMGLTTTSDATTLKTNYSGVLIDDFSVATSSASTIAITSSSSTGGNVTGLGAVYASGANATLAATPSIDNKFVNWTEGGTPVVGAGASYTFLVTTPRTLLANFATNVLTISQSTLSGFTYNYGSGPSAEQSFTVAGTNLTSNIIVTPPTDYEISTATGGSFLAKSSITLTQVAGIVTATDIYVRLKAGKTVANYNAENISVATVGMTTQNVVCSGSVAAGAPTLTFATPTSVSKTYGDAPFTNAAASNSGGAKTYSSGSTDVATVDATTGEVTILKVGSSIITINIAANGNYTASTNTYTVNVAKAASSISVTGTTNFTFTGLAQGPETSTKTGSTGAVSYSYVGVNGTTYGSTATKPIEAGNYSVTASVAADDNYEVASSSATSFTIALAVVTVDAPKNIDEIITTPTSDLIVSNVLTVNADKTVKTVTIDAGGKLDLGSTGTLTVTDLVLEAGKTTAPSVSVTKGMVVGTIKLLKSVDNSRWYFMSFPCAVDVNAITKISGTGTLVLNTNWWIKYYDGASRASNLGATSNWKPMLAGETLSANKGYVIGLDNTLTGNYVLSIPLLSSLVTSAEIAKTVTVEAYGESTVGLAENHKGWNLVGIPYMSNFTQSGIGAAYVNIYNGTTYIPSETATAPLIEFIKPFDAFFVQASTTGTGVNLIFDKDLRQLSKSLVATDLSDRVQLNFTSGGYVDKTTLIMDNNQTSAYEINKDLEKWITIGTAVPQVYTALNGINYAFNALPMTSVANLPLGVYSLNGGAATISASATQAPSLSKLILTDNVLNTTTNLLEKDYTYTATAGTTTTRFMITAQRVPTENNVIGDKLGEVGISMANGKLLLANITSNATVRVYDTLGRMVINKTANGNSLEIRMNGCGIYTIQIQSGTKVLTRKVIF